MKDKVEKVRDFNKAFGLPISNFPILGTEEQVYLKYILAEEENDEYKEAYLEGIGKDEFTSEVDKIECERKGIISIADALTDELYVLLGKFIYHGLDSKMDELFDTVHASNMSKLEDGKAIYNEDGKVMKGGDYFKPNLEPIVFDDK